MRRRIALLIGSAILIALLIDGTSPADAELVALIRRGDAYRDAFLYTAAADQYLLALDRQPYNPIVLLRLCDVSLRRKQIDAAASYADRAEGAGADPVDLAECRARAAGSGGQGALAAQQWSIVVKGRPTDRTARIRLIEAQIDAHDWANATASARAVLAANPDDATVTYLLGSLLALDDPLGARSVLSGARSAESTTLIAALDDPFSRTNRSYRAVAIGRVFLGQDRLALAWRAFLAAASASPDYADAFAYLGITYDRLGETLLAGAYLDRALDHNPNSAIGLYLRGVYASRHGQWADARSDLERAAQIEPDNTSIAMALVRVLAEQGEYTEAQKRIDRTLSLRPTEPAVFLALAELHIGRLIDVKDIGVPAARRAVEAAPENAQAHDWLGWGLHLIGDHVEAESELRRAITLDPMLARARLHLGNLLIDVGRIEEGRTELTRAAELDPQGEIGARARKLLGE